MTDLKFTATHEWLQTDSDGSATVGITDHAQQLLGDMVFVELPAIGTEFSAGDEMAVVESVKAASDVYAPISGVVTAVNEEVQHDPSLVNSDPFSEGWLIKIRPTALDEIANLLTAEQYENELAKDH